jgi:hypothetical protein
MVQRHHFLAAQLRFLMYCFAIGRSLLLCTDQESLALEMDFLPRKERINSKAEKNLGSFIH